jgi:hypothetical protein
LHNAAVFCTAPVDLNKNPLFAPFDVSLILKYIKHQGHILWKNYAKKNMREKRYGLISHFRCYFIEEYDFL